MKNPPSEKLPPFSEEAERAVLGAVLIDPDRCMQFLRGSMKMDPAEIYTPSLRVMFEQMVAMTEARRPIDAVVFGQWLRDRGMLDAVGGDAALDALLDATPTSAHLEHYAGIVREKFNIRRIMTACRETLDQCMSRPDGAQNILSTALASLQGVADDVMDRPMTNADVFAEVKANWMRARETRENGGSYLPGLRTPFARYNEIMGGLQPGLHFFGGKSSSGKTSMILNIVRELLLNGQPVLMIQLDDTHHDVVSRLVSMMAGVSLPALTQGFYKADAMAKIEGEIEPLMSAMPLYVHESVENMLHACDLARYYKATKGIRAVVIDYVQVMEADGNQRDDERQRLGKIGVLGKKLWKELRIPVLCVSQTAKTKDADDDGRHADMTDLFGASELAHHASSVAILKHVRVKDGRGEPLVPLAMPIDSTGHTKKLAVACHIKKNKHGPRDCMVMFWALLKYFQFEECPMIHAGGIDRQQTWEECMSDMAGMLAAQQANQARRPGFAL